MTRMTTIELYTTMRRDHLGVQVGGVEVGEGVAEEEVIGGETAGKMRRTLKMTTLKGGEEDVGGVAVIQGTMGMAGVVEGDQHGVQEPGAGVEEAVVLLGLHLTQVMMISVTVKCLIGRGPEVSQGAAGVLHPLVQGRSITPEAEYHRD